MKHLLIAVLALITFNVNAQEGIKNLQKEKTHQKSGLTLEQIAELQTKRMALDLDLNESQQQKIREINFKKVKERHAKRAISREERKSNRENLSADERFKLKSERLDKAMADKQEMKSILTQEQFAKWEKGRQRRASKARMARHGKMKHNKRQKRQKARKHHSEEGK